MNWVLLQNSLLVGGLTAALAVGLGALVALWVACLDRRWHALLAGGALLVLALPPFLLVNCWLHYLGHTGVWRGWLPVNLFSLGGAVWILALWLWPITFLAVWSAWQRLEAAHLESDMALTGAALIRVLLLPLARPALAQAALLTLVLALNHFAIPAILQVKVFPAEVWVRFSTTFDTVGALQLSWPMVLGPALLILWLARSPVVPWPHLQPPLSPRLLRLQIGPFWFHGAGLVAVAIYGLGAGLPLFQLVSAPRTWRELPGALAAGSEAVWNSFGFAALAATLVIGFSLLQTATATPAEPGGAVTSSQKGRAIVWLLWLPFLVPGVLLGVGLITLLNRPVLAWFYQSAAVVLLALGIRYLAVGWTAVWHALGRSDPRLLDVARLHGASRMQRIRYVHWPQTRPQVMAAWYIVFLLGLWDVETIVLIWPPGAETLALRIFNLLHYGHNAQVNALCLALLGLAAAPLVAWLAWRRVGRWGRSALGATWFAAGGLWLCGCGPQAASNETPLPSRLFDRVEIIASRGAGVGQVNKPRSVAVDREDNLYVVDMTGRVQKFDSNGVFVLQWQMPETDIGRAKGLCRDREGNIVVNEPHYARINHYSPAGRLVFQWGRRGSGPGELNFPRAVAVNSRNQILVSEYGANERVQRFQLPPVLSPGASVEFLDAVGEMGDAPGQFNRPEGLCVDAQDRIYVADSCNHRIQIFSPEGRFLRAYGQPGRGPGQLSYPYDICVDPQGFQYVCEFGNSRIQVFDANDRPVEIIGGPGSEPGRFSNPWGVALDSAGNLYVADSQNHRVQKLKRSRPFAGSPVRPAPISLQSEAGLRLASGASAVEPL